MSLRKLNTSSVPWFGLAGLAFVLGVFVLAGAGQEVALLVALLVFLGACLRGLVLGGQRRRRQLGEHPQSRSEDPGDNRRRLGGSTPAASR